MKKVVYLFLLSLIMMSCGSSKNTVRYTVASQRADCVGVGPQKCLLVKKGDTPEWQFFYSNIEGFNYEPGYEYVLDVREEKRENVPADASSIRYVLVKEISKTIKNTGSNLPSVGQNQVQTYQCTGKVLAVESENIGRGAAQGKFEVSIIKVQVTSSATSQIKEGDVIYCELIPSPRVNPEVGREYVFKAKNLHPAHAKGIYMLDTDVMDLIN